ISRSTGIPASRLTEDDRERLGKLEEELHQRIIGQDDAVTLIAKPSGATAPEWETRDGPWAASFSSAPPAWARPNSPSSRRLIVR
ncbi:chaperone protein ClpB, partial [Arthrobacter sp. Hiyo6]